MVVVEVAVQVGLANACADGGDEARLIRTPEGVQGPAVGAGVGAVAVGVLAGNMPGIALGVLGAAAEGRLALVVTVSSAHAPLLAAVGNLSGDFNYNQKETYGSWMVGLQWSDVFLEGNDLGFAVGQPQMVVATENGTPDDGNYAFELWYQFQVTDNIAITPGVFWLSRPLGDYTPSGDSVGIFGGLVQTVFKF